MKNLFIGSKILKEDPALETHFDYSVIRLEPNIFRIDPQLNNNKANDTTSVFLVLKIDGEKVLTAAPQEECHFKFKGKSGEHEIHLKHKFILTKKQKNFNFLSEKILFTIDGTPVHHTKTDPMERMKQGKQAAYLFIIFLCLRLFYGMKEESSTGKEIYIITLIGIFLIILLGLRIYKRHHIVALYIILFFMVVENIDYFSSFFSIKSFPGIESLIGIVWVAGIRVVMLSYTVLGIIGAAKIDDFNRQLHFRLVRSNN